jgi:tetratricopeptide (TPR) repeat protein
LRRVGEDPYFGLAATVVGWGALVYLFVPGVEGRDLIPVLPFLAALIAALIARPVVGEGRRRLQRLARGWTFWPVLAVVVVGYSLGGGSGLSPERRVEVWLTLAVGLATLGIFMNAIRQRGLDSPALPLLTVGLVYGVLIAGVWEARRAEKGERDAAAGRELARSIDKRLPVVCSWTNGAGRRLAFTLSRSLGRTVFAHPPDGNGYYLIAPSAAETPAPGTSALAEARGFRLWRFEPWETRSLLGEPLYPPRPTGRARVVRERELAEARAGFARRPRDEEAVIWVGRRTAYLGRYREAIAVYTYGLAHHTDSHKLHRHRGHRYITLRLLDPAIDDLERATHLIRDLPDEIEPDGLPNARNLPRSTSHSNIWYHLGLAYYLKGDHDNAARCYIKCLEFSDNHDMLVATSYWLYTTLRRLGRTEEAEQLIRPIDEGMDIIENHAYYDLLLMNKGQRDPSELLRRALRGPDAIDLATLGYGLGTWHLYNDRPERAREIFRRVVRGAQWAAFGHIAAEAELARTGVDDPAAADSERPAGFGVLRLRPAPSGRLVRAPDSTWRASSALAVRP